MTSLSLPFQYLNSVKIESRPSLYLGRRSFRYFTAVLAKIYEGT